MVKISVIIPIYNVEPYIRSCLQSVIDQTMTDGVECILVDDCGKDDSVLIAEDFIANLNTSTSLTFSILHHKQNWGLSAARNTGIRAAKGEYLYFLDSDDRITPDCLELMYSLAKRYDADFVQGAYDTTYPYMKKFNGRNYPEFSDDCKYIKRGLLDYDFMPTMAQNRLIKRQLIVDNNLYFCEGIIHEDIHWAFFLSKHIERMCFSCKPTYFYNVVPGSITSKVDVEKEIKFIKTYISDACTHIDDFCKGEQRCAILYQLLSSLGYFNREDKTVLLRLFYQYSPWWNNLLLKAYLKTNNNKTLHLLERTYRI